MAAFPTDRRKILPAPLRGQKAARGRDLARGSHDSPQRAVSSREALGRPAARFTGSAALTGARAKTALGRREFAVLTSPCCCAVCACVTSSVRCPRGAASSPSSDHPHLCGVHSYHGALSPNTATNSFQSVAQFLKSVSFHLFLFVAGYFCFICSYFSISLFSPLLLPPPPSFQKG